MTPFTDYIQQPSKVFKVLTLEPRCFVAAGQEGGTCQTKLCHSSKDCAVPCGSSHLFGLRMSAARSGLVSDDVIAFSVSRSCPTKCRRHAFYNATVNAETLRGHNVGGYVQRKTLYSNRRRGQILHRQRWSLLWVCVVVASALCFSRGCLKKITFKEK